MSSYDVLLVLNAQNSFLSPNGSVYMGERAEILKVRIGDYLSTCTTPKIFIREKHAIEDKFFIGDKTHSVVGTYDCQVCDELKKYADVFYDKPRYSSLYGTELESYLRLKAFSNVALVGLETHTSILFTAEDLRNKGYEVTLIEPCVMAREEYFHGPAVNLMHQFLSVQVTNG